MDYGIFFSVAFAESGDKVEIPVEAQPSNAVSFTSGYTQDYALNITTDPRAKSIERTKANYLSWAITSALGGMQRFGAPSWVGPSDNGGVPLAYPKGARVQSGLLYYVSLIENNTRTLTDTTAWARATYAPASNADALAGTSADLLLTPATLRYVLQNTSIGQQATNVVVGVTRYATVAETLGGIVTAAAVTPAGLRPIVDAKLNSSNPEVMGAVRIQPTTGSYRLITFVRPTADNSRGTNAYAIESNPNNGGLFLLQYDSAGSNAQERISISPYGAADPVMRVAGRVSASEFTTEGRVNAATTATEAASSTVRLATQAEMDAFATTVAVSPARVSNWVQRGFLPINNPKVTGRLEISAASGGSRYYNPANGNQLFYTNGSLGAGLDFAFNTANDDGSHNQRAFSVSRATGNVTFPCGITIPTGQAIVAPLPTYAVPSVMRAATQTEVNAGTLDTAALTPLTANAWANGRYLQLSGGTIRGDISVNSRDGGLAWRADNGLVRFFSNAEYQGNKFAFAYCADNGSLIGYAYTISRNDGSVYFSSNIEAAQGVRGQYLRSTSRADKKNIHRVLGADEAIARIASYRSHIGSWKEGVFGDATDTRERPFFLADEVNEHAPELVSIDDDGVPGAVGYSDEMPSVMVVLQHLLRKVTEQQAQIDALMADRK